MNIQKTAAKVQKLTVAVQREVENRELAVVAQGINFNAMMEKLGELYDSFVADIGKRQAKKVIKLETKAREARECLCTLQK